MEQVFHLIIVLVILSLTWGAANVTTSVILERYLEVPFNCTWKNHKKPSKSKPFIFFHQREPSGTDLRNTLAAASTLMHVPSCIAGHSRCGRNIFSVPWSNRTALYAGHFNWPASMEKFPSHVHKRSSHNTCDQPSTDSFNCVTNFREPVARVESCIYERFTTIFQNLKVKCINDIPPNDLVRYLKDYRQMKGNKKIGCLNEPFRIFGTTNEKTLSNLGYVHDNSTGKVRFRVTSSELKLFETALNNINHCVPVVMDVPHSKSILVNVFPALYRHGGFNETSKHFVIKKKNDCGPLDEVHLQLLRNVTALESLVYQAVRDKVQLAVKSLS